MIKHEKGFSLVELMIAMALGLVLFIGATHIILSSSRSWKFQDELARIHENARLALDILGQSISSAGYIGCPNQANLANLLYSEVDNRQWMMHFDKGILGIPSGSSVRQQLDSNAISEAIIAHSIDSDQSGMISGHSNGTTKIILENSSDYSEGDLLALLSTDCGQISVFRAGALTGGNVVTYSSSNSSNLYNCTTKLKGDFNCHDNISVSDHINHTGSRMAPLQSYAFYLRESNGVPTLYQKLSGEYVNGSSKYAEPLVEGIEDLSIRYGIDSDQDGVTNKYVTAEEMTPYSEQWLNVVAIKIELLARSLSEVASEHQEYFFSGQKIASNDLYIRRNFMKTIQLRNRGI